MPQKSSPKKSFIKGALLIVYITTLIVILFVVIQMFFKVKRVEVIEKNPSKQPLRMNSAANLREYNLLLTPESEISQFLKKSNPTVKTIEIKKELPDKLVVTLTYYNPFASLKGNLGNFILSTDGTVLAISAQPSANLPQITYYQLLNTSTYQVGAKINFEDIGAALVFLQSSVDLGLKITKIDINGYHMIALYSDKEKILFSQEKDVQTQRYQFETIIRQLKMQNKSFTSLDVRFDKPVIVF